MNFSLSSILALARYTVEDPRAAARSLMAMQFPDAARWLLLGIVASLSAVITHVGFNMLPPNETAFLASAMSSPVQTALLQAVFLLITVALTYLIGRWRGGTGSFGDALLLVGWLQLLLLFLQLIQIVALFIAPPVAEVIGILGLGLSFWLLSHFVAELHGFKSALRVFGGIVAAIFVAAFGMALLLVAYTGAGV